MSARASHVQPREQSLAGSSVFVRTLCRWWSALLFGLALFASTHASPAHDLAVDQVLIWPDPSAGTLRGQFTFDPELTRRKDAKPSAEYERKVVQFLKGNVQFTLDGRVVPLEFQVRELWVRAGATVGDLVEFSAPLPKKARALRLHASDAFKALVVSVQRVAEGGSVDTTSWLLGRGEWTPVYRIGSGWQEPGWREGGPDVFVDATTVGNPVADSANAELTGDAVAPGSDGAAAPGAASTGAVATDSVATGAVADRAAGGGVPERVAPAVVPAPARIDDSRDDTRAARPGLLAARFIRLGFEHILPGGIDHMLFVAGLVLGSARRYRQVLISLTLFTLAHTLTLGLGNFHVLQVPARFVEPLIALSIFLLGVDNLRARPEQADQRANVRYAVVFGFGLIHGLGFANALTEMAFDRTHIVLALFSFNLGVEFGQLAVVALLATLLHLIRERHSLVRYATLAGSAVIAVSGLFMVFDRLAQLGAAAPSISKIESNRNEV